MNRRWGIALITVAIVAAIGFVFRDRIAALNQGQLTQVIYLLVLLVLVGGGLTASRAGPHWLRNAALWVVIFAGIMGVYSMRDHFVALLNPGAPRAVGQAIELRRANDGHFWAEVEIDGVRVQMMVDTGASMIALTPRDARLIGLDPANLRYTTPVSTAQGETMAAPVTLGRVTLGSIEMTRLPAEVMREDTNTSLLGMTFLNRLDGYEVRSDALRLHPRANQ
jgi:aspartyl protease family protein